MKETVPSDKLLIFNAKDGISPLEKICSVKETGKKMPHINDKAEFNTAVEMVYALSRFVLAIVGIVVFALIQIIFGNQSCYFYFFRASAFTTLSVSILIIITLRVLSNNFKLI